MKLGAFSFLVAGIVQTQHQPASLAWFAAITILLFFLELLFYFVPGISLSSLFIAIAGIAFGFVQTFVISLVAVEFAHIILRKDFSIVIPDVIVLVPIVAFASFYGSFVLETFGWGIYGSLIGIIKWGVAIASGFLVGRDMSKRIREFILEPIANYLIFWKLNFLLLWLM